MEFISQKYDEKILISFKDGTKKKCNKTQQDQPQCELALEFGAQFSIIFKFTTGAVYIISITLIKSDDLISCINAFSHLKYKRCVYFFA